MHRFLRILRRLVIIILLTLLVLWCLVQVPFVQQGLVSIASNYLSTTLHTKVSVKKVYVGLLNKAYIEGVLVKDRHQDTLASIGSVQINLTDWFFAQKEVTIHYIGLKDARIWLTRNNDTTWNYKFLLDYFGGSGKSDASSSSLNLKLKEIDLSNVNLIQRDAWTGYELQVGVANLHLRAKEMDFKKGKFDIAQIDLVTPVFKEFYFDDLRPDADSIRSRQMSAVNYQKNQSPAHINPGGIALTVQQLNIDQGLLEFFNKRQKHSLPKLFDDRDIIISGLSGQITNLTLNGDTLKAAIQLKAKERSGLEIKRLVTSFTMHPQMMEFNQLDLTTNSSRLGPYFAMRYQKIDDMAEFIDKVAIEAHFRKSVFNFQDITMFAPELKNIMQTCTISADAKGTIADFTIQQLNAATGKSLITGSFKMKGLPNINTTQINFTTNNSLFALEDVAVWAPELLDLKQTPVGKLGKIGFAGSYTGTPFDFFVKGNFSTDVGAVNADFALAMSGAKKGFISHINSAKLQGGQLLGVSNLGEMQFRGTISSSGFTGLDRLLITGNLPSLYYNGYQYHDIGLNGNYVNDKLTADLLVEDANLVGSLSTTLDFALKKERYNVSGSLQQANLKALGILKDPVKFSGQFDVDFKGSTIDELLGYGRFYNVKMQNGDVPLSFDSLLLSSTIDTLGIKKWSLQTNEAFAVVKGRFNISSLPNSFQLFLNKYYPTFIPAPISNVQAQEFDFEVQTGAIEPFLRFFDPKIGGLGYANLLGSLNTTTNLLRVNAEIPLFSYDSVVVSGISLVAKGSLSGLSVTGEMENLMVNDQLNFPKGKISINTEKDSTHFVATTESKGPLGDAAIDINILSQPDGFDVQINESSFILKNKKWIIEQDGMLQFRNGFLISEKGVKLQQDLQQIKLYTTLSDEHNWNYLHVDVAQLNIGDLMPFLLKEPRLEGLVTGKTTIADPFGKAKITSNLTTNAFRFNNDSVGVLDIAINFDKRSKQLKGAIESSNPAYNFSALLGMNFSDSAQQQINTTIQLRNEKISVLNKYLDMVFDEVDGFASGNLQVVGKLNAPELLGTIKLQNGKFKVGYTKCMYYVDTATIVLGDNFIDFGKMSLKDEKNRTGYVEGLFYHRFFDSLFFNLRMRTNGMQVLNTKPADNDLFYGKAVAKANFDLYGPLNNLIMKMSAVATDSSQIAIANKDSKETGEADFLIFKEYGKEMKATLDTSSTNIHINLELTANPLVKIDVVLDETTGDIISANGRGALTLKTGTVDATTMRGRYTIDKGSYNYNFQSLIRKPFELAGDGNSYIEWNGDPMDANMNISATYIAKEVSLRDLIASENANSVLDQDARNYKGNVYVIARLKNKLSKPDIDFDIEFPAGSVMRNNLSAIDMLRRIREDESERLRQVTYLMVFRRFAPYKQGSGLRNPGTDLAVNTISELVSREMGKILTNVIQDITGDQSLQVDLSTNFYNSSQTITNVNATSQYDRLNVNFNLNKSYFNNRVVVNVGSDFDMNVSNTNVAGFQFLPDVSVEFILTDNRRLRFILFKRDNLDIAGRRNRAGASISYRKDFDKIFNNNKDKNLLLVTKLDSIPSQSLKKEEELKLNQKK